MAEKRISELTAATEVKDSDLFVLEQDGVAKKIAGEILKALIGLAKNGIPEGGEGGQVLQKSGSKDYDTVWKSLFDSDGIIDPAYLPIHSLTDESELPADGEAQNGHLYFIYE